MKTSTQILRDLTAGQSTTDALAQRMRQPAKVLTGFLQDLELDGLIESYDIKETLTVWRLTDLGRQAIADLNLATA
jgi:DNA-binding HxlR family transcriptional regulator